MDLNDVLRFLDERINKLQEELSGLSDLSELYAGECDDICSSCSHYSRYYAEDEYFEHCSLPNYSKKIEDLTMELTVLKEIRTWLQ